MPAAAPIAAKALRLAMSAGRKGATLGSCVALVTIPQAAARSLAASQANACDSPLQVLIDQAKPGSVLRVPPCVYRETVVIDKPITLAARPGAEIRGSEMWSSGWKKTGHYWIRGRVPVLRAHGLCRQGTQRCLWPEQVFYDGRPLRQVRSRPRPGEFAVDRRRNVVLADNPEGHVVEVTVRTYWVVPKSAGVTIRGFVMKHAAVDAQGGALGNGGYDDWTIENNVLSHAHGAVVALRDGRRLRLAKNEISSGGSLGVHVTGSDVLLVGNAIHHNNTELFREDWESGGTKAVKSTVIARGNEVYSNLGPGLWCDAGCSRSVFSSNRVYRNRGPGIFWEISSGAKISRNTVWENGWGWAVWGWGAGILVASSANAEVSDNVVAWNADGIVVLSQDRRGERAPETLNNFVHDNVILANDRAPDSNDNYGLAWLQDWSGGLYDPAARNRGEDNRYWYLNAESGLSRFAWARGLGSLTGFNATPGEEDGRYLSTGEKAAVVRRTRIPPVPTLSILGGGAADGGQYAGSEGRTASAWRHLRAAARGLAGGTRLGGPARAPASSACFLRLPGSSWNELLFSRHDRHSSGLPHSRRTFP